MRSLVVWTRKAKPKQACTPQLFHPSSYLSTLHPSSFPSTLHPPPSTSPRSSSLHSLLIPQSTCWTASSTRRRRMTCLVAVLRPHLPTRLRPKKRKEKTCRAPPSHAVPGRGTFQCFLLIRVFSLCHFAQTYFRRGSLQDEEGQSLFFMLLLYTILMYAMMQYRGETRVGFQKTTTSLRKLQPPETK